MDFLVLAKSKHGKGVFVNKDFKKGEEIIEFKGELLKFEDLPNPYNSSNDYYVQIGKDLYMGPSGDLDDFVNHSCNPNSGFKIHGKKAVLVAIRKIKKGEEITWDYSTTMQEAKWEMDCMCDSKKCRKKIRDFKHLPKKVQQRYIKLGIVPQYILKP